MRDFFEMVLQRFNIRAILIAEALYLGLTTTEVIDWSIRIITGIIVALGGLMAIGNYILKRKLLKKQIENEDQKLHQYLEQKAHERKG